MVRDLWCLTIWRKRITDWINRLITDGGVCRTAPATRVLLKRNFKLVEVPDDEFESMGCNVLAIAPRECMMVKGNPKTENALIKAGCKVTSYKGENISVYGGGGPTCLTRPLLREL